MIVPGPPGSVTDVRARWLSDKLTPVLGQPVVVDNRPGAGGNVGSAHAAKSPADGYTILVVHQGTVAINPHVYDNLGYDPLADLAPITRIASNPLILAVHSERARDFDCRADRAREGKAGATELRLARATARRRTWRASSSSGWPESRSRTCRTRAAPRRSPTSWPAG